MAARSYLAELSLSNVAIVERLRVEFGPGFNALTGETGAGKSIIVDSLEVALGERGGADMLRAGSDRGRVEAVFELGDDAAGRALRALLEEQGLESDDSTLVITRDIGRSRTASRVNGQTVALSVLQRIGRELVDIHAQSDHQSLLRGGKQLLLLDRFAGCEEDQRRFAAAFRRLRELRARRARLVAEGRDRARRVDTLHFEIGEIDAAHVTVGEDEELNQERLRLANAERLAELARGALLALRGEVGEAAGAEESLAVAVSALQDLVRIDPALAAEADLAQQSLTQLREVSRAVLDYAESVEYNPARLDEVQARLALLGRLQRKYGDTLESVLAYREQAAQDLADLEGGDEEIARLDREEQAQLRDLVPAALTLSARRHGAAANLGARVTARLVELGMPRARFEVALTPHGHGEALPVGDEARFGDETGLDAVEFLFTANAGEPPRPLARVASGGEVARTMLAIKSELATADTIPTVVFDEVEVGVGGRLGSVIAERLSDLSRSSQLLVVTHLPQVAARADRHLQVRKVEGQRTGVVVQEVEAEARLRELAEMIGGSPPTPAALRAAEEMLQSPLSRAS